MLPSTASYPMVNLIGAFDLIRIFSLITPKRLDVGIQAQTQAMMFYSRHKWHRLRLRHSVKASATVSDAAKHSGVR